MTDETTPENQTPEADKNAPESETNDELIGLKEKVAKLYLKFLDQNNKQRQLFIWISPEFGVSLNPAFKTAKKYLLSQKSKETGTEAVDKKLDELEKNMLNKFYNQKKLDDMQKLIADANTEETLEGLREQINDGKDPTKQTTPEQQPSQTPNVVPVVAAGAGAPESSEEMSDRRKAVVANIDAVLQQDKIREDKWEKEGVDYKRGGHTNLEAWLDCGGLLVYCANQAGLEVTGNGRWLFEKFPSKRLEVNDNGAITTDVSEYSEWDIIVWDALDPAYYGTEENKGRQHTVKGTEGQEIHPHHFGFIKSIDKEKGIVNTIESNGSNGVTDKTPCNVSRRLDTKKVGKEKSAIRAVRVNYDKLNKLPDNALTKLENLPWSARAA